MATNRKEKHEKLMHENPTKIVNFSPFWGDFFVFYFYFFQFSNLCEIKKIDNLFIYIFFPSCVSIFLISKKNN